MNYGYSLTSAKKEYQLTGVMETDEYSHNSQGERIPLAPFVKGGIAA
jgi:hypothetical protein